MFSGLAPIFAMIVGLALFMGFYTLIEMTALSDNLQMFLTVVWFGVGIVASVEMATAFGKSRERPGPLDEFEDFHQKVRRSSRKRRARL